MGRRKKVETPPTLRIDEMLHIMSKNAEELPKAEGVREESLATEGNPKRAEGVREEPLVAEGDPKRTEGVREEPLHLLVGEQPQQQPPSQPGCECLKYFLQAFKDQLGEVDARDTIQQHIWTLLGELRLLKSYALEAHYAERDIQIYKGQIERLEEQVDETMELLESKELRLAKFEKFVDFLAEDYSPRAIQDLWRRASKELSQ